MVQRNLAIRLSLKDAEVVKRGLEGLGAEGQQALTRIEHASRQASRALATTGAAADQSRTAMQRAAEGFAGMATEVHRSGSAMEQAIARAEQEFHSIRRAVDPASAALERYENQQRAVRTAVAAGVATQEEAARVMERLRSQYAASTAAAAQHATAANRTSKAQGQVAQQTQNASYQIGDYFTQIASGQNSLVALSQQIPQLLGGFGVIGAALGAAAAIGGAFLVFQQKSAEASKEQTRATKNYADSLKAVRDIEGDLARRGLTSAQTRAKEFQDALAGLRKEVEEVEKSITDLQNDQLIGYDAPAIGPDTSREQRVLEEKRKKLEEERARLEGAFAEASRRESDITLGRLRQEQEALQLRARGNDLAADRVDLEMRIADEVEGLAAADQARVAEQLRLNALLEREAEFRDGVSSAMSGLAEAQAEASGNVEAVRRLELIEKINDATEGMSESQAKVVAGIIRAEDATRRQAALAEQLEGANADLAILRARADGNVALERALALQKQIDGATNDNTKAEKARLAVVYGAADALKREIAQRERLSSLDSGLAIAQARAAGNEALAKDLELQAQIHQATKGLVEAEAGKVEARIRATDAAETEARALGDIRDLELERSILQAEIAGDSGLARQLELAEDIRRATEGLTAEDAARVEELTKGNAELENQKRQIERLSDFGADAIESIFDPGGPRDFFASVVAMGRRAFAELASQQIVVPIIAPIVQPLAASITSAFGGQGPQSAVQAAAGGANAVGAIGSIGNLFKGGSFLGAGSGSLGSSLVTSGFGQSLGLSSLSTVAPIASPFGNAGLQVLQPSGFGSFLEGGLNNLSNPLTAPAGLLGGLGANLLFGGGPGTSIGSTLGGVIGGFTPLGPVGSLLGSFLGGGIGSLFGGNFKPNASGSAVVGIDGRAPYTISDEPSEENAREAQRFADLFGPVLQSLNRAGNLGDLETVVYRRGDKHGGEIGFGSSSAAGAQAAAEGFDQGSFNRIYTNGLAQGQTFAEFRLGPDGPEDAARIAAEFLIDEVEGISQQTRDIFKRLLGEGDIEGAGEFLNFDSGFEGLVEAFEKGFGTFAETARGQAEAELAALHATVMAAREETERFYGAGSSELVDITAASESYARLALGIDQVQQSTDPLTLELEALEARFEAAEEYIADFGISVEELAEAQARAADDIRARYEEIERAQQSALLSEAIGLSSGLLTSELDRLRTLSDAMGDLTRSAGDLKRSLSIGGTSPLSVGDQYRLVQGDFRSAVAAFEATGDASAGQEALALAGSYQDLALQMYGATTNFVGVYQEIQDGLGDLASVAGGELSAADRQLDALRSHARQLDEIAGNTGLTADHILALTQALSALPGGSDTLASIAGASAAASSGGFDETSYLINNPDVAGAVSRGDLASGLDHFVRHGQAEGRESTFDETAYLAKYPDVRLAVEAGILASGADHYLKHGKAEGRTFATGGAFTNGIVQRPTAFNLGLMGERGPEGILPLANIGGSLGVRADMGGSREIVAALRDLISENARLNDKVDRLTDEVSDLRRDGNDNHREAVTSSRRNARDQELALMGGARRPGR